MSFYNFKAGYSPLPSATMHHWLLMYAFSTVLAGIFQCRNEYYGNTKEDEYAFIMATGFSCYGRG